MTSERPANDPPVATPLPPALRRELVSRAHQLQPRLTVGKRGISSAMVAQVRQIFAKTDLLKVKVLCGEAAEAEQAGRLLARDVPCHQVARLGKTLVLYKPPGAGPGAEVARRGLK